MSERPPTPPGYVLLTRPLPGGDAMGAAGVGRRRRLAIVAGLVAVAAGFVWWLR